MRSALISTDPGVRDALRRAVTLNGNGLEFAIELTTPLADLSEEQVTELRNADPQLVILDFEDPATAVSFARFLTDGSPQRYIVGAGPQLAADVLLEAMRAGVAEYLPKPLAPDSVKAALERAARRLGWTPTNREPGQLYTVFSPKGGAGTTSVATNLAIILQRLSGKKTLLVDFDFELGEIAVLLGARPRFSFIDLVQNFHRIDADLLGSFIEHHDSGVDFLSAPFHAEPTDTPGRDQIRSILHYLKRQYDYVIVDTPKSFSLDTMAAFEEADRIFVVSTVDVPSLRNLQRCMPLLQRVSGKEHERVRLVVNRYHPDDVISLEDVHRTVGLKVYWTLSNDYEAVSRAINSGNPVAGNAKSRYARDLQALAADLIGVNADGNGNGNGRTSSAKRLGEFIGRLRRRSLQEAS